MNRNVVRPASRVRRSQRLSTRHVPPARVGGGRWVEWRREAGQANVTRQTSEGRVRQLEANQKNAAVPQRVVMPCRAAARGGVCPYVLRHRKPWQVCFGSDLVEGAPNEEITTATLSSSSARYEAMREAIQRYIQAPVAGVRSDDETSRAEVARAGWCFQVGRHAVWRPPANNQPAYWQEAMVRFFVGNRRGMARASTSGSPCGACVKRGQPLKGWGWGGAGGGRVQGLVARAETRGRMSVSARVSIHR